METGTYYDFFVITGDGKAVRPNNVWVSDCDGIQSDFRENDKRLARWTALWDILIEPVLLELLGFLAVYLVFSLSLGRNAWYLVLALMAMTILIEGIVYLFKSKTKRRDAFQHCLENSTIFRVCYNFPGGSHGI